MKLEIKDGRLTEVQDGAGKEGVQFDLCPLPEIVTGQTQLDSTSVQSANPELGIVPQPAKEYTLTGL